MTPRASLPAPLIFTAGLVAGAVLYELTRTGLRLLWRAVDGWMYTRWRNW